MNNNISNIQEEVQKQFSQIMANKFFFKKPPSNKIIMYLAVFLLLTIFGPLFNVELISSFLIVFPLAYVLGATNTRTYIMLVISGSVITFMESSLDTVYWYVMHALLSYIIYYFIGKRYSKIVLTLFIATFLFSGSAIGLFYLINTGYIPFSPKGITAYLNDYINTMATQPNLDRASLTTVIDSMLKTFPVTYYVSLVIYTLLLLKYTLVMLSREYVIIPTFPKFSALAVRGYMVLIYVVISFVAYLVVLSADGSFDFWSIFLSNISSIFSWLFIINGLFTVFFFFELKEKSSQIMKILSVPVMFILPGVFELIGLADSILKLREYYQVTRKGGR